MSRDDVIILNYSSPLRVNLRVSDNLFLEFGLGCCKEFSQSSTFNCKLSNCFSNNKRPVASDCE